MTVQTSEQEQGSDAAEVSPAPVDGPQLDLGALDGALSPLRRLLRFCSEGSDSEVESVRFIEANGVRSITSALSQNLPLTLQEQLASWRGLLTEIDGDKVGEKRSKLIELHQSLTRLDSVLGLPLPPGDRIRIARSRRNKAAAKRREMRREEAKAAAAAARKESAAARNEASDAASEDDELLVLEDSPKREARPEGGNDARKGRRGERSKAQNDSRPKPVKKKEDKPVYLCGDWFGNLELEAFDWAEGEVAALQEADLVKVLDLVRLRPVEFETVRPVVGAGRDVEAGRMAVGGRVRSRVTRFTTDGQAFTEIVLWGVGPCRVRWSGVLAGWLMARLERNARVVVVGDMIEDGDEFILTNPELAQDDGKHSVHLAKYGIEGVRDEAIRLTISRVWPLMERLVDPLPSEIIRRHNVLPLGEALRQLHANGQKAQEASRRMALDEALLMHLGLMLPRYQGPKERGIGHSVLHGLCSRLQQMVDVELNDEQQRVLDDIKRDLRKNTPMRRVLTGEVGTGIGTVATLAAVTVAETRCQVLLVAPDTATAEQRFAFAESKLRDLGLVARLLDDSPNSAQRDAVRRGEVHVVFGTHKLLEEKIEFKKLGLVVVGERGQYGSANTWCKEWRAPKPDVLIVTSTPVPKSISLSAYSEWTISELDGDDGEVIETVHFTSDKRDDAYALGREALERGEQVIVVFPMAADGDILEAHEAVQVVAALEQDAFKGQRVGLFHGKMSREERVRTYSDFRQRRLDVLVATTHFEAGPDLPGVSTIIVEQADRMLLQRMHRVRGTVVGHPKGKCLFVTGQIPDEAGLERVGLLVAETSGYALANRILEADGRAAMLVKGGDFEPKLRWFDPAKQNEIVRIAREEAYAFLDLDPSLKRGNHREYVRYLSALWSNLIGGESMLNVANGGNRRRRRRRKRN